MAEHDPAPPEMTSWIRSERPERDSRYYLLQLRRRWWQIAIPVVLAVLAAAAYVHTAQPVYQSQSNILLSPVPSSSALPISIPGLVPQSADPTRDAETAANVIGSLSVAAATKRELHSPLSPSALLAKISVQPVANSSVLAITAQADSATAAAHLANVFTQQVIATRTTVFRNSVTQQINGLRAQVASAQSSHSPATGASSSLAQQLAELEALRAGPLPDMSISSVAVPPPGRTSPRAAFSLAVGLVVGLVIGVLGALGLEALDSTLHQEDQLRALFNLPILARIPREGGRTWRFGRATTLPRTPDSLSSTTLEAFRTLRAMTLVAHDSRGKAPRSILVTSAAPDEGKTTTALNLAWSLAASGVKVILIEADLRRPAIGTAMRLLSPYHLTRVLTGEVELERALVSSKRYPGLRVLLAQGFETHGELGGDALFLPSVARMLSEAEGLADIVVIDAPPLLAVIDALELGRQADSVLLVAQLKRTHLGRLEALGTLLADARIRPAGIALVGGALPGGHADYAYQSQAQRPDWNISGGDGDSSEPRGRLGRTRARGNRKSPGSQSVAG